MDRPTVPHATWRRNLSGLVSVLWGTAGIALAGWIVVGGDPAIAFLGVQGPPRIRGAGPFFS